MQTPAQHKPDVRECIDSLVQGDRRLSAVAHDNTSRSTWGLRTCWEISVAVEPTDRTHQFPVQRELGHQERIRFHQSASNTAVREGPILSPE